MADRRALVRNASDPRQVKHAERTERRQAEQLRAWIKATLSSYEGRAVLATLLEECGLFESVFDHSGSVMYFREGRRNEGLKWQARLVETDEQLYEQMERERRARRRQLDATTQAVQAQTETGGES